MRARNHGRADDLSAWLDGLVMAYGDRILPVDRPVADAWGGMVAVDDRSAVDPFSRPPPRFTASRWSRTTFETS